MRLEFLSVVLVAIVSMLGMGVLVVIGRRLRARIAVLEAKANQLADALDQVPSFIYMKDSERRFTYANKLTLERLGVTAQQLLGTRAQDYFLPSTAERIQQIDLRVLQGGESSSEEVFYGEDPETRLAYLEIKQPLHDKDGRVVGLLGVSTELTELHRLSRELEMLSITDSLTGIANRRCFDDRLCQALNQLRRNGVPLVLILLDVDYFKKYNDTYGHRAGDAALQAVASALASVVARAGDVVARVGGEEFALLLNGNDLVGGQRIAEAARAAVQARDLPHEQNSPQVLTISLGIALATPDDTPESLYQRADGALYASKDAGRNRVSVAPVPV